jgi:hypothetical protein
MEGRVAVPTRLDWISGGVLGVVQLDLSLALRHCRCTCMRNCGFNVDGLDLLSEAHRVRAQVWEWRQATRFRGDYRPGAALARQYGRHRSHNLFHCSAQSLTTSFRMVPCGGERSGRIIWDLLRRAIVLRPQVIYGTNFLIGSKFGSESSPSSLCEVL